MSKSGYNDMLPVVSNDICGYRVWPGRDVCGDDPSVPGG